MLFSRHLAFALLSVLHISDVLCADTSLSADGFFVGTEEVTQHRAKSLCEKKSMKLLSIENAKKNEQIAKLFKQRGIDDSLWTSGSEVDDKIWGWLNGDQADYTSWDAKEPNAASGSEKCIEIKLKNNKIVWNDHSCKAERGYICEKRTKDDAASSHTKKFYISTKMTDRDQAVTECEEMSMKLASLKDDDENEMLYQLVNEKGSSRYWTSGGRLRNDGATPGLSALTGMGTMPWTWLDGEHITNDNWDEDEPNSKAAFRSCIEVFVKGGTLRWNDHECSAKRKFACEKK